MLNRTHLKHMLLFAAGLLIGGSTVEIAHRNDETKMLFARKQKCQAIAAAYSDGTGIVTLSNGQKIGIVTTVDKVDYSPARNSCIAVVDKQSIGIDSGTENVVDILTHETLYSQLFSPEHPSMFSKGPKDLDAAFQKSLRGKP